MGTQLRYRLGAAIYVVLFAGAAGGCAMKVMASGRAKSPSGTVVRFAEQPSGDRQALLLTYAEMEQRIARRTAGRR